jgi:hypothetical protein
VQAVDDVHATPKRRLPTAGLGVGWICHTAPFHRSASVDPSLELPTAVHAVADVHATPASTPPPAGGGVDWICQRLPFHRSTRSASEPDPSFALPTAMHAVADVHATPLRLPYRTPAGLGLGWIRHVLPFHRSTNVNVPPLLGVKRPTAIHAEGDEHATPSRAPPPPGVGVDWIRHRAPSHRSANGTSTPELLVERPTAKHDEALGHDIPDRNPCGTNGAGLGTIDQPAAHALATLANDPNANTATAKTVAFFSAATQNDSKPTTNGPLGLDRLKAYTSWERAFPPARLVPGPGVDPLRSSPLAAVTGRQPPLLAAVPPAAGRLAA